MRNADANICRIGDVSLHFRLKLGRVSLFSGGACGVLQMYISDRDRERLFTASTIPSHHDPECSQKISRTSLFIRLSMVSQNLPRSNSQPLSNFDMHISLAAIILLHAVQNRKK